MEEAFLGEIRMFAGDFVPNNYEWALCNGRLMPRLSNQALFSIIGYTFGGDGKNFAVPDFRGRLPVHVDGTNYKIGEKGGEESNQLTMAQLPPHEHDITASRIRCNSATEGADSSDPTGRYPAYSKKDASYSKTLIRADCAGDPETTVLSEGKGLPLENRMSSLSINFIMAIVGLAKAPLTGEVQIFCGKYAPLGWLFCDGQILDKNKDYAALHDVIEYVYGGSEDKFALPDLRERAPVGSMYGSPVGESSGKNKVELTINEMPKHIHKAATKITVAQVICSEQAPASTYWGGSSDNEYATQPTAGAYMAADAISLQIKYNNTSPQPIDNRQPLMALKYIICYAGLHPSRV